METGADGKQRTVTADQGLKVHKKTLGSLITIRACLLNGKSVKRTLLRGCLHGGSKILVPGRSSKTESS